MNFTLARSAGRHCASLALASILVLNLAGCSGDGRPLDPTATLASNPTSSPSNREATQPGSRHTGNGDSGTSAWGGSTTHPPAPYEAGRPDPIPSPITGTSEADAEWIGPEGGSIMAGNFEIAIPAGALDAPVQISISDCSGMTGRIECELLPHGLKFKQPVTLTVKVPDNLNASLLTLFWIVDEGLPTENWAPMPTRKQGTSGTIIADLTHFSRYAPGQVDGKAGWGQLPSRGADAFGQQDHDRRP